MKRLSTLLLLSVLVGPAVGQSLEETFQRGLRLERTQGDYAGAISLYESIARDTDDRRLGARALMQLARAQENLGRSEAAQTYRRLIADYADITDMVAEARAGYARTREPVAESVREPFSRSMVDISSMPMMWGSALSPSGQYLAEYRRGRVHLMEVATERSWSVPVEGVGESESVVKIRFAPDERQVALITEEGGPDAQVRVLITDLEAGSTRLVGRLDDYYADRGIDYGCGWSMVEDWSRDGENLLVMASWREGDCSGSTVREEYLLVPVDGSTPRLVGYLDPVEESYAGGESCISPDGRLVFSWTSGEERESLIRRFDVATGESVVWRKDAILWGCSWDPQRVIYVRYDPLDVTLLHAGAMEAMEESPDEFILRLGENLWAPFSSGSGDLPLFDNVRSRLLLAELDSETGDVKDHPNELSKEWNWALAWSPSGDRLAHVSSLNLDLSILDVNDGRRSERRLGATSADGDSLADRIRFVNWIGEENLHVQIGNPSHREWANVIVGADGEERVRLSRAGFERAGLMPEMAVPVSDTRWIAPRSDVSCVAEVHLSDWTAENVYCSEGPGRTRIYRSPYGSRALITVTAEGEAVSLVLLDLESGEATPVAFQSSTGQRFAHVHWIGPNEVYATGFNAESPDGRDPMAINVETGEARSVLAEFADQFRFRKIALQPGGGMVAAFGTPRQDQSTLTILHNVVGGR